MRTPSQRRSWSSFGRRSVWGEDEATSQIILIVHIVPDAANRKFFLNEGIVSTRAWCSRTNWPDRARLAMPMELFQALESGVIRAPWMERSPRSRREETP